MGRECQPRVALADPTAHQGASLLSLLQGSQYSVATAADATGLLRVMAGEDIDLVLLEPRMPGGGLPLVRKLKQERTTPIIIVSAGAAPHERAAGLEAGADDYVGKPIYPAELLARMDKLLAPRPVRREAIAPLTYIAAWRHQFSRAEWRLLERLAAKPGQIVSRDTLAGVPRDLDEQVEVLELRRVDVLVSRIRTKLRPIRQALVIETCRGFGYRLRLRI